jgi:cell division protein FtsX
LLVLVLVLVLVLAVLVLVLVLAVLLLVPFAGKLQIRGRKRETRIRRILGNCREAYMHI